MKHTRPGFNGRGGQTQQGVERRFLQQELSRRNLESIEIWGVGVNRKRDERKGDPEWWEGEGEKEVEATIDAGWNSACFPGSLPLLCPVSGASLQTPAPQGTSSRGPKFNVPAIHWSPAAIR